MAGFSKKYVNIKFFNSLTPVVSKYTNHFSTTNAQLLNCSNVYCQNVDLSSERSPPSIISDFEKKEFLAMFPAIVEDLTSDEAQSDISESQKWFKKVLQYNAIGGNMAKASAVYLTIKENTPEKFFSSELKRKAQILGWALEMFQAYYLVADDIMDAGKLRRGKPCWYLQEGVGLGAINDSLLLNAGVYKILSLHFKNDPSYVHMLDLLHDISFKTALGQCLDMLSCPNNGRPNFSKFTIEHYNVLVKYKTSFYAFCLPICLAMYTANITDPELHRQARTILLELGLFYQIQDDYIDCFGDPKATGKLGTDISEGKCTWLAVMALRSASNSQRKLFEENYGKTDDESLAKVKELYEELNLPAQYRTYESTTYDLIGTHIQQISKGLNKNVFMKLLDNLYKRSG